MSMCRSSVILSVISDIYGSIRKQNSSNISQSDNTKLTIVHFSGKKGSTASVTSQPIALSLDSNGNGYSR